LKTNLLLVGQRRILFAGLRLDDAGKLIEYLVEES